MSKITTIIYTIWNRLGQLWQNRDYMLRKCIWPNFSLTKICICWCKLPMIIIRTSQCIFIVFNFYFIKIKCLCLWFQLNVCCSFPFVELFFTYFSFLFSTCPLTHHTSLIPFLYSFSTVCALVEIWSSRCCVVAVGLFIVFLYFLRLRFSSKIMSLHPTKL